MKKGPQLKPEAPEEMKDLLGETSTERTSALAALCEVRLLRCFVGMKLF